MQKRIQKRHKLKNFSLEVFSETKILKIGILAYLEEYDPAVGPTLNISLKLCCNQSLFPFIKHFRLIGFKHLLEDPKNWDVSFDELGRMVDVMNERGIRFDYAEDETLVRRTICNLSYTGGHDFVLPKLVFILFFLYFELFEYTI